MVGTHMARANRSARRCRPDQTPPRPDQAHRRPPLPSVKRRALVVFPRLASNQSSIRAAASSSPPAFVLSRDWMGASSSSNWGQCTGQPSITPAAAAAGLGIRDPIPGHPDDRRAAGRGFNLSDAFGYGICCSLIRSWGEGLGSESGQTKCRQAAGLESAQPRLNEPGTRHQSNRLGPPASSVNRLSLSRFQQDHQVRFRRSFRDTNCWCWFGTGSFFGFYDGQGL